MKIVDVTKTKIDNTDNQGTLQNINGNMIQLYHKNKDNSFDETKINEDYHNKSLDDKRNCNDQLNETTEMLLTDRSSDLENTDTTDGELSDDNRDNSSENSDDACSEGSEESDDDDRIDTLNDTMDSFESCARQWQTSAIKLGMSLPPSWKSCVTLSEGKVGIKIQRNKIQNSFSVKSISSNSFSFHSNLTLHSEDPMFEQKVAILEEVQNKQNKDIHSCDVCPREFTKANQLKLHMKTHTGAIKPFKCDDCSKRFKVSLEPTEPFSSFPEGNP